MKLTTKNVMFILMCVLLALTMVMVVITLGRVSDFLQLGGSGANVSGQLSPSVTPSGSDGDSVSAPSTQSTAPHDHEYVKTDTFSPNCVSSGYTLYECACGKTDIRDFKDPYGHNYGKKTVIAATCETDGWTERTCSRCNNIEKTNIVTASHSFDDWTEVNSADGTPTQEERICYACGITEIRSLDTANTWVLRLTELEAQGDFAHYRIVVDLADNENDPAYDVYSALVDPLRFDYVGGELWVYFSTEGIYSPFSMSTVSTVVTFYADGNISLAEPEITPEPDTGTETPDPDTGGEGTGEGTGEESTGGDETPSDPADTETE